MFVYWCFVKFARFCSLLSYLVLLNSIENWNPHISQIGFIQNSAHLYPPCAFAKPVFSIVLHDLYWNCFIPFLSCSYMHTQLKTQFTARGKSNGHIGCTLELTLEPIHFFCIGWAYLQLYFQHQIRKKTHNLTSPPLDPDIPSTCARVKKTSTTTAVPSTQPSRPNPFSGLLSLSSFDVPPKHHSY